MAVFTSEIKIDTNGEVEIIDITDDLQKVVKDSKINNGIICVFIPGSTGTITTIEYEPVLKKDFPQALEKIAPKNWYYVHHETWNDDNGHCNVNVVMLITMSSETIYVVDGLKCCYICDLKWHWDLNCKEDWSGIETTLQFQLFVYEILLRLVLLI